MRVLHIVKHKISYWTLLFAFASVVLSVFTFTAVMQLRHTVERCDAHVNAVLARTHHLS